MREERANAIVDLSREEIVADIMSQLAKLEVTISGLESARAAELIDFVNLIRSRLRPREDRQRASNHSFTSVNYIKSASSAVPASNSQKAS